MADTFPTLANLLKINDKNALDLGLSDILNSSPVLRAVAAIPASNGTQHKYLKRTTAPSAGSRAVNDGIDRTYGADTLVTIDLDYYDADHLCDVALAKGYKGGPEGYIAREIPDQVKAALFAAEKDMIVDLSAFAVTNSKTVDAEGTTVAGTTSVFAIRVDGDKEVAIVAGNDGVIDVGETSTIQVTGSNSKTHSAYLTPIGGYFGVQMGSIYSVARIVNLTAESGKGLTDDLIAELLNLAPADRPFTHLIMNRQSLGQLQQSRTATNATGAPAPFPVDAFGTPIIVTESVLNTQAVVA